MTPEKPRPDPPTSDLPPTVDPPALENSPAGTEASQVSKSTTGWVPTFPKPVQPAPPARKGKLQLPAPGDQIDDFEILQVLGSGAFATVFLAKQLSLGRQVALKVSANRGTEARTLASLEHDHIVSVFSESVDAGRNLRLMCMQYVAGTTLERVIRLLSGRDRRTWSGVAVLEVIDVLSTTPVAFDPAALRDRELLAGCDYEEAVCWLGSRLAEALAHAHNQGVLHRDIKPANILLNRYGRPFLADFNVSLDPGRTRGPAGEIFGGTLGYMAPEHLDAFNHESGATAADVDQRSDIYSLGLVLFEMLTGRSPFGAVPKTTRIGESLRLMATERRGDAPSPRSQAEVPEVLDRVVRRCLDPKPNARYQTAADLAQALEGCREHRRVEKELPPGGMITRLTLAHPVILGIALMFLPHVFGSAVNIPYNAVRIVDDLTPEQKQAFNQTVLGYNLIVYPFCIALAIWVMRPIARVWRQLNGPVPPSEAEVDAVRRKVLRLPGWGILLSCIGWLPGGILFPLAIDRLAGPIEPDVYWHFLISFTLSGLIALTYTVFGLEFIVLRILYPRLWINAQDLGTKAGVELRPLRQSLWFFQLLAGLIPLAGAVLMMDVGPEDFDRDSYRTFRFLMTTLIFLGMFGFGIAITVSNKLQQILTALTRQGRRPQPLPQPRADTMVREIRPTVVGETKMTDAKGNDS